MLWCSYSVTAKPRKVTKAELYKEMSDLIIENSILWFMLKEKCPDIKHENLVKQVDDRINKQKLIAEEIVKQYGSAEAYFKVRQKMIEDYLAEMKKE